MAIVKEAKGEKLSKEEDEKFDKAHKETEEFLAQADKLEKLEKMSIDVDTDEPVQTTIKKEFSKEETEKVEKLALTQYLSKGTVPRELHKFMAPAVADKSDNDTIQTELRKIGIELAATQTTTTTGGGYTIPRGFQAELEKALRSFGGMWESARIIRTSKGNTLDWPTVNDTTNKAYLLGESQSAITGAQPVVFGQQQFEAYKYTSGLIQIPTELVEDSEFDITSEIRSLLTERIFRGTNEAFTTADGSSKPKGVVAGSVYAGTTTATITADNILDLEHAIDPAYRTMRNARFMFHDSTLKAIKKLSHSSTDARPLWLPSIRENEPATLYGKPYTINQDMAELGDGAKWILFGDFDKYILRVVRDMRIVRLNERFGELDQVAFVVFIRVDGDILNGGTNPIKHLRVDAT
jgi:HK97 family phage major capsid protein